MSIRHFCTYFDHRYLPRAMVLRDSLSRHAGAFHLWALCMDESAEHALRDLRLPNLSPISLTALEAHDPDLLQAKADRSVVEYYFTCTPSLPRFLLDTNKDLNEITYLDADLYFLSSPDVLFDEFGDAPAAIIPHRYPLDRPEDLQWGVFNVGWLTFRRSEVGMAALDWWRARCLEWCYDRVEGDKFADQRYLDRWPELFPSVHVVRHPGANLAPWNVRTHALGTLADQLTADGEAVVFYHVQGLRRISGSLYRLGLEPYGASASRPLRRHVYRPYIRELQRATLRSTDATDDIHGDSLRHARHGFAPAMLLAHAHSLRRHDLMLVRNT